MAQPPRDASTVLVVRDTSDGIEVYMLRRSSKSPSIPDAYVFPGGMVDRGDRSPQARLSLAGAWRPAEPAFTYTAIRETFEECGLLFADAAIPEARLREARTHMLEGKRSFNETLNDLGVKLDARAVHYFSRWITPSVIPQRFDARFFVARVPPEQVVFPTVKHLERIAAFPDVETLLNFADGKTTIPVTPEAREGDEGLLFTIPPTLENMW
jgi:8-oxo-dGTP pyrophosphatase MutT (NUDIX family)